MPSFQESHPNQTLRPRRRLLPKPGVPHLIRTNSLKWLAAISLFALSGCTDVKVKLGMKVYLAKTPVDVPGTIPIC